MFIIVVVASARFLLATAFAAATVGVVEITERPASFCRTVPVPVGILTSSQRPARHEDLAPRARPCSVP